MNLHLNTIISMNGYGVYIWPAYCLTLFVFGINLCKSWLDRRKIKFIIQEYLSKTNAP